jgi:dTDP-4-dehydrorhamnose 3,5-epimerase
MFDGRPPFISTRRLVTGRSLCCLKMKFHETSLPGVFEIQVEPMADARGFFARTWCAKEFEARGLNSKIAQCSTSFNTRKGTLRGIHFQALPHLETKIVRCTQGAIFDVVVDLRPQSPSFKSWIGIVLSAAHRNSLYIPEGCGHGFLTLEDDTEIFYQISEFYHAELSRGVRWNDPAFQIVWPGEVKVISERDSGLPDFES